MSKGATSFRRSMTKLAKFQRQRPFDAAAQAGGKDAAERSSGGFNQGWVLPVPGSHWFSKSVLLRCFPDKPPRIH